MEIILIIDNFTQLAVKNLMFALGLLNWYLKMGTWLEAWTCTLAGNRSNLLFCFVCELKRLFEKYFLTIAFQRYFHLPLPRRHRLACCLYEVWITHCPNSLVDIFKYQQHLDVITEAIITSRNAWYGLEGENTREMNKF